MMIELAGGMMWAWIVMAAIYVFAAIFAEDYMLGDTSRGSMVFSIFPNLGMAYAMWSIANTCDVLFVLVIAVIFLSIVLLGSMVNMSLLDTAGGRLASFLKVVLFSLSIAVVIWAMAS